jgi:Ca2+:H+ antiporter
MWLLFTLVTHRKSFDESPNETPRRIESLNEEATNKGVAVVGAILAGSRGGEIARVPLYMYKEEECSLSLVGACITLVISVVLLAFNTQFATDSIQGILLDRKVSQTFLSLIILPLLSNDPMAINMAMQNNLAMSISLTLERCIQTCLLVVPLTILLAWCMGIDDMDLEFDGFSIMTLFVSIIIVTYVIQEGKSTWYVEFSTAPSGSELTRK